MIKLTFTVTLLFFYITLLSQKQTDSSFYKKFDKAINLFLVEKYDSALQFFISANTIAEKQNKTTEEKYSSSLNNTGYCYMQLQQPQNAHFFMYKSLLNARKYKHLLQENNALYFLNILHDKVVEKDWQFNYPEMTATYGSYIYFPILTTETISNSDSIRVVLLAGKYDGINDSSYNVSIYKRFDKAYEKHEDVVNMNNIAYGRIVQVQNNRTVLHVKSLSTLKIEPKDIASIFCQTPMKAKKNNYMPLLDRCIFLMDNTKKDKLISRRFLLHYDDEMINFELVKILKEELFYVQKGYAKDTLDAKNVLSEKATEGIFKGVNIIKALDSTNTKHIVRFINFIKANPGKYLGNSFSFAEVYATWLLNNTPLAPDDILHYLVATEENKRTALASALKNQIKNNNVIESWVTQTLNALDKNDLLNIRIALLGFGAVYKSEKDNDVAGWVNFFKAMYDYKTSDLKLADSSLKKASQYFTQTNNKEGLLLVNQAQQKIYANKKVSLEVQNGEFSSYLVAMHPSGKFYATKDYNSTIRIWDLQLGKVFRTFQAHDEPVNAIAYSSNGRYFATCSDDKSIKIWSTFNYSVITTIPTNAEEYCLAFSPNNIQLASGGKDSLIKVWDIFSGKKMYELQKHKGIVTQLNYVGRNEDVLFSSGTDSIVYHWNLITKKDVHWYNKKAKLLNMKVSYNGNYMFYTANDSTINVWNLYKNKFYFKQKIAVAKYGSSKFYTEPDFSPDGNLLTFADEKNRIVLVDLNAGFSKTISKESFSSSYLNTLNFTTDQKAIFATYPYTNKTKLFDISQYKSIHDFNIDVEVKTNNLYTNPNMCVQFSSDDKFLFTAAEKIGKFNFTNNTTQPLFYAPQFIYNDAFMLNDSVSFESYYQSVSFFNHTTRKKISNISLSNNDSIAQYYFNKKNQMLYLVGIHGKIEGFKVSNFLIDSSVVFSAQLPLKENKNANIVKYHGGSNSLVISTTGDEADLYSVNLSTTNILTLPSIQKFADFGVTKSNFYFNHQNGTITKNNLQTLQIEKEFKLGNQLNVAGFMKLSPNKKLLAAYYTETDLAVIDIENDKVLYTKKAHDIYAMALAFSNNNQFIATGGFDSKICLFNAHTGEKLLNIFTPSNLDYVTADTLGNYMASKNSLDGLSFKLNENIYPFEQFDLQYNRPDLVLAKTGLGDTTLIEAYKKAVEKRLKKNNFTDIDVNKMEQLPTLTITDNTDVSYFTNQNFTELTINCFHAKNPIKALHVLVNNNPIYGFKGKNIGTNTKDTTFTIQIPLAVGKNAIKLFCTNSLGQNSLQQTFEVQCNSKTDTAAKTWFVGIGVSNYKDKNMSLQYAAKDIRDLAKTFTKGKKNLVIDTLIDSKATLQNILNIRKKLLTANPNDKIVLAVTGHGLLDKNLDFYYATYDVDFNNPSKNGLKYELLEYILDSVPAQKKLLLIDACHSGALDKEALLADTGKVFVTSTDTAKKNQGVVKTISRSTIKNKKPSKVSLNNTFELMQNMFSDFANNNGSMVISAAGGLEYAFESPTWNNGVFTYCVRKGLENLEADEDGNYNGKISVNELLKFVSQKVVELTAGKQKPTSRRELLSFDWEL